MFEYPVRNQARVFLNAAHLQARGSSFAELLQGLGEDFLPRALAELSSNGNQVQRLGAATPRGDWSVHITAESVDVTYAPGLGATGIPFPDFCARAARYLQVAHALVDQPAHRIALVREGLDTMGPEQLEALGSRLLNRHGLFDAPLVEWDWRAVTNVTRAFGAKEANTNTIGILRRVEAMQAGRDPEDRLWVSTDVNTLPRETRPRFSPEDAAEFVTAGVAWHAQLEQALKDLVEKGAR